MALRRFFLNGNRKQIERNSRILYNEFKRFKSTDPDKPQKEYSTSPLPRFRENSGVPLDKPLPGVPEMSFHEIEKVSYDTKVSTLENGLRVGSQQRFGQYATIGVAISAGSRYETGFPNGICHLAEKLGFMSTENYASRDLILKTLEDYGAISDCQSSRDTTVYAISTEIRGVGPMLKLLADVVLKPLLAEDELEMAKMSAKYELEDLDMRPEQESQVLELIHKAAWGNSNLGYPKICSQENADKITRDHILHYMKLHYTPPRMVISGVGVDHNEFVDYSKEYFVESQATWNKENVSVQKPNSLDQSVAKYVGGDIRIEKNLGNFNAGPLPVPSLAHVALGVESISYSDPDFIPACVLNLMMGGGGSFSAGGPGKGMYSRLYTNVLNVHHWMYNATAYNNSYSDSGLFCIYASAPPTHLKNLTQVLIKEFHSMVGPIDKEELERAKTQLQSMLLMNLESRPVVFEDIGRQILAHGHYKTPLEYIKQIEKVTADDILNLCTKMMKSKPSLAALGSLEKLPSYEKILSDFSDLSNSGGSNNKFNFFRG